MCLCGLMYFCETLKEGDKVDVDELWDLVVKFRWGLKH